MTPRKKAWRVKKISIQRWEHSLKRKFRKKQIRNARLGKNEVVGYISPILSLFGQPFRMHKQRGSTGPQRFRLPRRFSLTDNPNETIEFIRRVAVQARNARRPRLILDHRNVVELGLAAEAVLAVLLKEISIENQTTGGSYVRGYTSQNPVVRKMMDEVGCVRVLRSGAEEDIKVSLKSTAKVFRHQNRGKSAKTDPLIADPISVTTKEFSDHLDSCLALIGKRLSPKGRDRLLSYVGEVLTNADEHSGTAQWTIVGYVDQEDEGLVYRAAIFSIGNTIAETFIKLARSAYAWNVVSPYLEQHQSAGFFGPDWDVEDLLTVIALQGNISSLLDGPGSDRGQGTVDLIRFFQDVSGECTNTESKSAMSIISGRTHIKFDGTFQMMFDPVKNREVIAFNSSNNLGKPPDRSAVHRMASSFPGVMISIAVPLAAGTLEEIPEELAR